MEGILDLLEFQVKINRKWCFPEPDGRNKGRKRRKPSFPSKGFESLSYLL
jgi:hypothetical protein